MFSAVPAKYLLLAIWWARQQIIWSTSLTQYSNTYAVHDRRKTNKQTNKQTTDKKQDILKHQWKKHKKSEWIENMTTKKALHFMNARTFVLVCCREWNFTLGLLVSFLQ